jgi:ABC-type nitrate/sulfonate/bicarbonate transport system substrate-binding protein
VIAGSIDIAMTNGTLGAIAAYAKGMPVKIISAEATGAPCRAAPPAEEADASNRAAQH